MCAHTHTHTQCVSEQEPLQSKFAGVEELDCQRERAPTAILHTYKWNWEMWHFVQPDSPDRLWLKANDEFGITKQNAIKPQTHQSPRDGKQPPHEKMDVVCFSSFQQHIGTLDVINNTLKSHWWNLLFYISQIGIELNEGKMWTFGVDQFLDATEPTAEWLWWSRGGDASAATRPF